MFTKTEFAAVLESPGLEPSEMAASLPVTPSMSTRCRLVRSSAVKVTSIWLPSASYARTFYNRVLIDVVDAELYVFNSFGKRDRLGSGGTFSAR